MEVLNNKVLVRPDKPKTMTEGGIAVPETSQEKPRSGIIILTTNDKLKDKRIYYPSYSGIEIELKFENKLETFHIVSEKEIWLSDGI